jgi:hypothetical protein
MKPLELAPAIKLTLTFWPCYHIECGAIWQLSLNTQHLRELRDISYCNATYSNNSLGTSNCHSGICILS